MAQTLIAVDRDELAGIVAEAVQAAAHATKPPNPRALTTGQLKDAYSISEGMVKKLRRQGLPCFFIGDSPRFDADVVHAWLLAHGEAS